MNTQNVNYSDLSVTMIKELLKYDNELNVDSFYQLTYNKNVKYFKYSNNNEIEIKLLDDSNITIIVDKERGSWSFKKWLIRLTKREKQNTT